MKLIWKTFKNKENIPYYYNLLTNESVWEKPKDLIDYEHKAKLDEPIRSEIIDKDWVKVYTKFGRIFYYSRNTKESFWNMPIAKKPAVKIMEVEQTITENKEITKTSGKAQASISYATELTEADVEEQLKMFEDEESSPQESDNETPSSNEVAQNKPPAVGEYKDLLKEKVTDVYESWENIKNKMSSDARYDTIANEKQKKKLFDNYIKELSKTIHEKQPIKTKDFEELVEEEANEYFKNENNTNREIKYLTLYHHFIKKYRKKDEYKTTIKKNSVEQQTVFKNVFRKVQAIRKRMISTNKNYTSLKEDGFNKFLDENKTLIKLLISQNKNITLLQIEQRTNTLDARYKNIETEEERERLFEMYKNRLLYESL